MYRVRYYMTGGGRTAKDFNTIREALRFSYSVPLDNFYEIEKL